MAIDHIIFNNLKWFNIADDANEVTINHKIWTAHPASVTVKEKSVLTVFDDNLAYLDEYNLMLRGQQDFKCLGKAGNVYIVSGYFKTYDAKFEDHDFNSESVVFAKDSIIAEHWS
jgi:hypothetical protein